MPFKDRYWWLVRLGGIALTLSTASIIGWILWQSPIIFPDLWGGDFGRLISNNTVLVAFCGLFFLQGIAIARSSAQARDRYNRRRAALHGDLDAISVARITLHPENAPDVAESPLVLRWTASKAARWILAPMGTFAGLLCLAVPIFTGAILLSAPRNAPWESPDMGLLSILIPIALVLLIVECCVVGVVLLIRDIPTYFGRRFGLNVDPEGVLSVAETGRRRFLRWEEMRLLEVTTNDTRTSRTFRLYGPATSIEWSLFSAGAPCVPDGISAAEMVERSQSLLDLINARTGLLPRTFDKPSRQLLGTMGIAEAIGCIVVLALATIGFVAGLILVPVTSSHLLNISLAGVQVYIAIALASAIVVRAVQEQGTSMQQYGSPQVSEYSAASHVHIVGPTVRSRLAFVLSGLILCVDLIPSALWLLSAFPLLADGSYPRITGTFGYVASLVLLPIGLFGLGMIVWALWSRVTSITADAAGLTERRGRKTKFIAWNQVEHVKGFSPSGTITAYNVQGASITIWWSANDMRPPRPGTGDGVLSITANGLANLVAARTGKALTIGEHSDPLGDY